MSTLLRCLRDYRELWRYWILPLVLVAATPPLLFALPLLERHLIDRVLLERRFDALIPTLSIYGGVWLLISLMQIGGATLRVYLGEQLVLHLRSRLFAHCEALSVPFAHREHSGRTMALFSSDVPAVANFMSTTIILAVGSAVALLVGALVMFQLNWQLALLVVVAPPLVAAAIAFVARPLRQAARLAQEKAADVTERLHENLAGIREIVAFGREELQGLQFARTMGELLRLRMRVALMDRTLQTGQSLFSIVVTLVIFGFGGYLVIIGHTTLGTLIAIERIFGQVYRPAVDLVGIVSNLQKVLASADRIYAFLDQQPLVTQGHSATAPASLSGAVTFDSVSFGYQAGRPVLHDVSFEVRAGEMIALVGPSGAGKTTLVSLIARFYDPTAGRIRVDDVDLRDLTLSGLRRHIGIVFQDSFLFATTVRENLTFGREGASEAEIMAAARAANALEFIERLPNGLDTQVGQRGVQLSEGQKQRLAIARALLRAPRILILDEPTSALDARSEHLLQSALDNVIHGRTTFVIAHRLATVLRADRIFVLDGGRIVEQGTHQDLLSRHGLYSELFALQFGASPGPTGSTLALLPEPSEPVGAAVD